MTTDEQQQFIDEGPRLGQTLSVGSCPLHGPLDKCAGCAIATDADHITGAWVRMAIDACVARNLTFTLYLDETGFVARASEHGGEPVAEGWSDDQGYANSDEDYPSPAQACYQLLLALREVPGDD